MVINDKNAITRANRALQKSGRKLRSKVKKTKRALAKSFMISNENLNKAIGSVGNTF